MEIGGRPPRHGRPHDRGVTKPITLHAESSGTDTDPWGNERVGIEATGELSRSDFGMKFNQALGSGNLLVGDKVRVDLQLSAVKQASSPGSSSQSTTP